MSIFTRNHGQPQAQQIPRANTVPMDLIPSSYPLAIIPNIIAQKTTKINMVEKPTGLHEIYDLDTNMPVLKVIKEDSVLHATKQVKDARGRLLFKVKERQSTSDTQMYVKTTDDERILWAGEIDNGRALATFLNQADGPWKNVDETLYIKNMKEWRGDGSVYIKNEKNNENVALVHRDGSKYRVAIATGVDISLIVAVCIAFDHKAIDEGYTKEKMNGDDDDPDILGGIEAAMNLFGIGVN